MSARAEKGVSGGGLITAVHPAAKAAPSLRVIMAEGKFQGVRIDLTKKQFRESEGVSKGTIRTRHLHEEIEQSFPYFNSQDSQASNDTPIGCLMTTLRTPGKADGICSV